MNRWWPGNVHDLRQTILRVAIFEDQLDEILDEMEAERLAVPDAVAPASESPPAGSKTLNRNELKRDAARRALVATPGHYGRAAALLGVSAKARIELAAEACPERQAKPG